MQQAFQIEGMHCNGCVARVKKALEPLADEVTVTLQPPRITIDTDSPLTLDQVRAAVAGAGDYKVDAA